MNSAPLPRDTSTLQAMVVAQQAEIEHLKLIIAKLRRMQFGQSSEKIDEMVGQLELALEELETGKAEQADLTEITPVEEALGKPIRKPLPDHLPRDTVVHAPEQSCCPDCGGHLKPLGEDVSEVLDYVPASFRVIRHVRSKLACGRCDTIVQAPAAGRPIARGMAGSGLLAHVLVAKYCDHLPLYRQSGIYAREGVDLERSTLADWVGQCSALLRPLVERLRQHVLAGEKLHADDTPVPVLAPGDGKTKTGRLWTYVRDDRPAGNEIPPAVWFAYSPNRKGEHPQTQLKFFKGILQADAFAGFDALYAKGDILEAACWAHYLESVFIWSGWPATQVSRRTRGTGARHKVVPIRGTARTRADRASVSTAWHGRTRVPHVSRRTASLRVSSSGSSLCIDRSSQRLRGRGSHGSQLRRHPTAAVRQHNCVA